MAQKLNGFLLILAIIASCNVMVYANKPHDIFINVMAQYIDARHKTGTNFTPDPGDYVKEIKLYQNGKLIETFKFTTQKDITGQRVQYAFPTVRKGDKLTAIATCVKGPVFSKDIIATYGPVRDREEKKADRKEDGLSGVPSSWNGDYALENKPKVKALTVRGGRIYTVFGSSVTETFPGKSTLKYKTTYSETECKQTAGSTVEVKFTRDSTGKIKYFISGSVDTYVKMK